MFTLLIHPSHCAHSKMCSAAVQLLQYAHSIMFPISVHSSPYAQSLMWKVNPSQCTQSVHPSKCAQSIMCPMSFNTSEFHLSSSSPSLKMSQAIMCPMSFKHSSQCAQYQSSHHNAPCYPINPTPSPHPQVLAASASETHQRVRAVPLGSAPGERTRRVTQTSRTERCTWTRDCSSTRSSSR